MSICKYLGTILHLIYPSQFFKSYPHKTQIWSWLPNSESLKKSLIDGPWYVTEGRRVWTQSLQFARQAIQYLSHIPIPFCFSYFSDKIVLLAWSGLGSLSSYLHLWYSWEHKSYLTCSLRYGLTDIFFFRLASNPDSLLCLPHSWDYRHELFSSLSLGVKMLPLVWVPFL
jgi:hypothetical protein